MRKYLTPAAATALALVCACGARAQIVYPTVLVGNPGNPGKLSGDTVPMYGNLSGTGATRSCGSVAYPFRMGKFEVTSGQYTAFLNAVASHDPYSLYNVNSQNPAASYTSGITRLGSDGSYTYTVPADWANRPVGGINFTDACRFANWMHNGQPSGVLTGDPVADAGITEDGSYALHGYTTNNTQVQAVVRKPNATWVVPTEDEWFKAAYHKNNGPTGSYWDFPTKSDAGFFGASLSNDIVTPDPGNNANFNNGFPNGGNGDNSVGPPYWRTEVGEFENSGSPYGTFDQGGNVWEWTETYANAGGNPGSKRVVRGGSYLPVSPTQTEGIDTLHSAWRFSLFAATQLGDNGFRLANVTVIDDNNNGIADYLDIANGTSHDYNFNGVPDEVDIATGHSQDCNHNGIPDEAETGNVVIPPYALDDSVPENFVGPGGPADVVWMNQYTVQPGRSTISAVGIIYGFEYSSSNANLDGQPVTIYLWSDPDQNGVPLDAHVLASVATTIQNYTVVGFPGVMNTIAIPETYVGPAGTIFYVRAKFHTDNPDGAFPAAVDFSTRLTTSVDQSWMFTDSAAPIDPNNLGAAQQGGSGNAWLLDGSFIVRAIAKSAVANVDANHNGIPDSCECHADFNQSGGLSVQDIFDYLNAWFAGDPRSDFNGVNGITVQDIFDFLNAWFAGC